MRYAYIDNTRALALFAVIGWHCYFGPNNYLTVWVLPVFFIIMGLFYKHQIGLKSLVVKKVNGLIVPWILFSIPAIVLSIFKLDCYPLEKVYNPYACINSPSWFLLCMFWCYLLFWMICELSSKVFKNNSRIGVLVLSAIVTALGYYSGQMHIMGHRVVLPLFISASATCLFFVALGYSFKSLFLDNEVMSKKIVSLTVVCLVLNIISVALGGGKSFNPQWNQTEQPLWLVYVNATTASYIVFQICKWLPLPLTKIGSASLVLLCTHGYIYIPLMHFFPEIDKALLYLVCVGVSVPATLLIYKYYPLLSGKAQIVKYENSKLFFRFR